MGFAVGESSQYRERSTRLRRAGHGPFIRHYVAEQPAFTRASERPSGSQDAALRLIGLPRAGSYCYGVHIAGNILLVRKRVG